MTRMETQRTMHLYRIIANTICGCFVAIPARSRSCRNFRILREANHTYLEREWISKGQAKIQHVYKQTLVKDQEH
jgi:hypothetical protein